MKRPLRAYLADNGPVTILAGIAAVGSFDHISTLAAAYGQHGWRAWAVAVCIDLTCVMAAREIQRDKHAGRPRRGPLSWPSLVLAGGIILTLAANLAQAPATPWGRIMAATPAGAFLIAMSMLERRAAHRPGNPTTRPINLSERPEGTERAEPVEAIEGVEVVTGPLPGHTPAPELTRTNPAAALSADVPGPADPSDPNRLEGLDGLGVDAAVVDDARFIATEHARLRGTPIGAAELARRLRLPEATAKTLLTHLDPTP